MIPRENPRTSQRRTNTRTAVLRLAGVLIFFSTFGVASASHHYTDRQLDALAARVGKTYWLSPGKGRLRVFLTSRPAGAATFRPAEDDSFVITELAGRKNKNPYYEVKFASGKVGFISPELFQDGLNLTILSLDPHAGEKEKAEKLESEEKARVEWINSQPWSGAIKEAAIRKQPAPGLTTAEVKKIMGDPLRITKTRTPVKGLAEEHWFYADDTVLIFHNGLLIKRDIVRRK